MLAIMRKRSRSLVVAGAFVASLGLAACEVEEGQQQPGQPAQPPGQQPPAQPPQQ